MPDLVLRHLVDEPQAQHSPLAVVELGSGGRCLGLDPVIARPVTPSVSTKVSDPSSCELGESSDRVLRA